MDREGFPRRRPPRPPRSPRIDFRQPPRRPIQPSSRPPSPPPPRPAGHRRDPAPFIIGGAIALLVFLVFILFLPPLSLVSGGGGSREPAGHGVTTVARDDIPPLPRGFTAITRFYQFEISEPLAGKPRLRLPIKKLVPGGLLGFYAYADGVWQRLAPANISGDGKEVFADLDQIPPNGAVLHSEGQSREVWGFTPADGRLDPKAGGTLTALSPRAYRPTAQGTLLSLGAKEPASVDGLPLYPTIVAEGQELAPLLSSPDARRGHVDAIIAKAQGANYAGINIDYRSLEPSLGPAFTDFAEQMGRRLREAGRKLALTLPTDEGTYDWERLGRAADFILLYPERDPLAYRQRMPQALTALTQRVDSRKVLLVVSPFSYEQGPQGLRPLTLPEAMGSAAVLELGEKDKKEVFAGERVLLIGKNIYRQEGATGLRWSDEAAMVFFRHQAQNDQRTVWIENAFSAAFKLEMVTLFDLAGAVLEDASGGSGGADLWPILSHLKNEGFPRLLRPNSQNFNPQWQANGGKLEGNLSGSATWTAPDRAGLYEVSLAVSDGISLVGRKLSLEVKAGATPAPTARPTVPPATPTATPTAPAATPTASPTTPPTATAAPTPTPAPTPTATAAPTPTPTPAPTSTPAPTPTATAAPTPTRTPTPTPRATATP